VGTVYKQGNILFTPDGTRLVSPVGNRVTVFDLAGCVSLLVAFSFCATIKPTTKQQQRDDVFRSAKQEKHQEHGDEQQGRSLDHG